MTSDVSEAETVAPKKRLALHRLYARQHKRFSWYPRQLLRAATQVDLAFESMWRHEKNHSRAADTHLVRAVVHMLQWAFERPAIEQAFDHPAHRKAEDLAFQADMALRKHRDEEAKSLYLKAAILYRRMNRDITHPEVRGIFALSAVQCFLRASQQRRARITAREFLSGPQLLPEKAEELRRFAIRE